MNKMSDIKFACPKCHQNLTVDSQGAGLVVKCPHCASNIQIPPALPHSADPNDSKAGSANLPYAVKVLTSKDRAFGGKFDPQRLEGALNSYAAEGWSMAGCDSAEFPGMLGGVRSELISVMHGTGGKMKKYKILTQKDRFFGGKLG
jgi:DNA-directed RNA polymerase subunit RPC12/RpoP